MPDRNAPTTPAMRVVGYLALVLLAVFVIGLLAVNYRAALGLLVGVALAWVLLRILRALTAAKRRGLVIALLAVLVIGGTALTALFVLSSQPGALGLNGTAGPSAEDASAPSVPRIREYRLTVEPGDQLATGVIVREELLFDVLQGAEVVSGDVLASFPERMVESRANGFLLREVTIEPLGVGAYGSFALGLPDGSSASTRLCSYTFCPPGTVRLRDFPRSSFFAARGVTEFEALPYVNTETVTWSTNRLEDGVTFSYMPPPLYSLRPVLAPLVGASKANEWVVGLIGMIGAVVASPFVKPVLEDILKERIADLLKNLFGKRTSKKSQRRR